MARYQDQFTLNTSDIDRIERALRHEMSLHARSADTAQTDAHVRAELRELSRLLGKIHNQKIFYAQVNATGIPSG